MVGVPGLCGTISGPANFELIVDVDLGIELAEGFLRHLLFVETGDLPLQLQAGGSALEPDGRLAEMGLSAESLFGLSQVDFGFGRKNRAHGRGFREGTAGRRASVA